MVETQEHTVNVVAWFVLARCGFGKRGEGTCRSSLARGGDFAVSAGIGVTPRCAEIRLKQGRRRKAKQHACACITGVWVHWNTIHNQSV